MGGEEPLSGHLSLSPARFLRGSSPPACPSRGLEEAPRPASRGGSCDHALIQALHSSSPGDWLEGEPVNYSGPVTGHLRSFSGPTKGPCSFLLKSYT